jgi:hypothetical protein
VGITILTGDDIPVGLVTTKFAELGNRCIFTGNDLFGPEPVNAGMIPDSLTITNGPGGAMHSLDTSAVALTFENIPSYEICETPILPPGWYAHVSCAARLTNSTTQTWPSITNVDKDGSNYEDPLMGFTDGGTASYVVELCCYGGFGIDGTANAIPNVDLTYDAFVALSSTASKLLRIAMYKSSSAGFTYSSFTITLIPPTVATSYRKRLEDLGQRPGRTIIKAGTKTHVREDPSRGWKRL